MHKSDKERVVAELAERLRTSETLIVADYRGLSMPEIDELRTRLLESGARFSVVKNTLTRRAAEEAGVQDLLNLLEGPTAIAFIESEGDPVAVAKALAAAARETRLLEIRGGVLDGKQIGQDDVRNLATLPAADVLRAQLVGAIAAPLTTVVGLFTAPLRDLVNVIDARIEQLREQGEDVPAEEPAAEADAASGDEPAAAVEASDESQEQETEPPSPEGEQPSGETTEEE